MASQTPSASVKVASSAATYTAATQDIDLRSQINNLLIKEGASVKIQERLLHLLHAHPSNWPTAVQTHALSLLRSGEVSTFHALVRRVIDDIQRDTVLTPFGDATNGNGTVEINRHQTIGAKNDATPSLAVPRAVMDEAFIITRDCLDNLIYLDEDADEA